MSNELIKFRKGKKDKSGGFEPRRASSRHLLAGLVYCGANDGEEHPTSASTSPAKEGIRKNRWDYYICMKKMNTRGESCQAKVISSLGVQQAVLKTLMNEVLTLDNLRPLAQQYSERHTILDKKREYLKSWTSELHEMSRIYRETLAMELAAIPSVDKELNSATQGMDTAGKTARFPAKMRQIVTQFGIVTLNAIRF